MRLLNITAIPNPIGNRIELHWKMPDSASYPRVRVVRREGTHATSPNPVSAKDGVVVSELLGQNHVVDNGLRGETVYYYSLFPYKTTGPDNTIIIDNADEQVDLHNRASAMATAPYNFARQMYDLLPVIYHRYDTILPRNPPDGMLEDDKQKGQLRRFVDLPGSQFDQIYSFSRAMLDLHNLDRIDGRLLPLLAEWIGWKTDHRLEIETQRNEIRNAPMVYETIGIIPVVESTVKRISGWESRTKEFVHNVFLSNRPERLNLWARRRDGAGNWLPIPPPPPSLQPQPLSVNFAYEGRPTAVRDGGGTFWLFYHTYKKSQWNIWYKTSPDGQEWTPSQALTNRGGIEKHPAAAVQGTTLWVFWDVYDEVQQKWRIDYRTRTSDAWSAVQTQTFLDTATATATEAEVERRLPAVVADNAGGLWLFWLEKAGTQWQLRYNRHDGTDWQLNPPVVFPLDAGVEPRVEGDVWVLFHSTDPNQSLWVFWSRQEPVVGEQTRHTIAYRVKQGIDPNVSDWSAVRTLPKAGTGDYQDREPAPLLDAAGNIELFWSSNQAENWSIWRNTLDVAAHSWAVVGEQITSDPYSQRAPLAISISADTLLIYRSSESLTYNSTVYSATETVDFRYAGSTTADTRNAAKIALRGQFDDFQRYTYDAGSNGQRTNLDWYARDTIGLYLTPDTADPEKIVVITSRLSQVLNEFMPITDRAVFIT